MLAEAQEVAAEIGYPVLIKAAAGGGGRGIRLAEDERQLSQQFAVAQQEARSAFGRGDVYLEKAIERAHHIEVQVLGDGQRVVHLFERECSLQRRRQKVVEEALSPSLDPATRQRIAQAAVRLSECVGYSGAGTVEFLYDPASNDFYFIEMNTRIQVEHPVTELVTGVDLIKEQIRVGLGEPLRLQQEEIVPRGWAMEFRINAEDAHHNFRPSPGRITELNWPSGPGVRIDSGVRSGSTIPPFYDSMIAKLIVWGESRDEAISRALRCLEEIQIEGIDTTVPLHRSILKAPEVLKGEYDIHFLERWLEDAKEEQNGGRTSQR
jgi:acetyl-CoA carboxylase biotin carboxylase subunit